MDAKCTMKCQLTHVLPHKNKLALNIVQLSPKGEVNRGGYIPGRKASRLISSAVHRPNPNSNQLEKNEKSNLFVN